jgi:hypothetical protein
MVKNVNREKQVPIKNVGQHFDEKWRATTKGPRSRDAYVIKKTT